ncbi:hypothetical protein SEA_PURGAMENSTRIS_46 [Mycobacterium phage Purgamenstris]|uniref:Uncharacterized protein n=1 Tax=Mycobacterium phage Purgamenstris TaxID=2530142 RepID=A0A481VZ13_9CAUD|nr:hypothetical protein EB74_34050 [Mycobacterium sp. SWH-M5]QBI99244.1 hypothetical protein SEA_PURGAMENSTRIS_46 [Mycobacterium phage Purgamenstris]
MELGIGGGGVNDTRVTRAIALLLTGEPRLVDEACDLMEELREELPAPRVRPVWCPHDSRQAEAVVG